MARSIVLFFLLASLGAHAALTLVTREPFIGPGLLTAASPGTHFSSVSGGTFTLVRVGPRTSSIAAPGWSADVRIVGSANVRGTVNLTGASATSGLWGTWIRLKKLPPAGSYLSVLQLLNRTNSNIVADFRLDGNGVLTVAPFNYGGTPVIFTGPTLALNTWVWVAVAWQNQTGNNFPYGIRCMSMPLGGALSIWGSADGLNALDSSFSSVNVGLQSGGVGPMLRVGCPSLYALGSFSDVAYPADIVPPVEQSYSWYVNTVSGNDGNDGLSAATAWKTAAKINLESQYCGMLDSNAAGPGGGDVLTIDTSGAPLVLGASTLTFNTQGLSVQPVSGQTTIKCQAEEFLANAGFSATSGLGKTYQTPDTQIDIVAWENDMWMWHVQAASFSSTATVTNPRTSAFTAYASAGAALDATPGSFYTDGANLYIHPFNDTNPISDGNTYTRSMYRNGTGSAVTFTAGNFLANGFYVRKTTLVDQNNDSLGAYCFQDGVASGTGFSSEVENGYFGYGDKHCFGATTSETNSRLLVFNTDCEQGNPYCEYGGQTPFVSYTGVTTGDVVHTYKQCTCVNRSGLIGSAAGDPVGTGGDIILSHNNGTETSYGSITIDDCNFASGSIDIGVAQSLVVTDHTQTAEIYTACPSTTINETTFTSQGLQMQAGSGNLLVENCRIAPVFALSANNPAYYGFLLRGKVTIEGCTFDLANLTGNTTQYFQQGFITRLAALNLTFIDNDYLVANGENIPVLYGTTSSDTLNFNHNAYDLGSGTAFGRSIGSTSTVKFSLWRAMGEDEIDSTLNANLLLQNDVPQAGSPLINAGQDLGAGPDFTGTVYSHRNTIGAYESSAAYLAPQTISGYSSQVTDLVASAYTLPATTQAGLAISYSVISGPGQLNGDTLTFSGTGTVVLEASQAGNSAYAPLTELEDITVSNAPSATDTPALPPWALVLLGGLLALAAGRRLRPLRRT